MNENLNLLTVPVDAVRYAAMWAPFELFGPDDAELLSRMLKDQKDVRTRLTPTEEKQLRAAMSLPWYERQGVVVAANPQAALAIFGRLSAIESAHRAGGWCHVESRWVEFLLGPTEPRRCNLESESDEMMMGLKGLRHTANYVQWCLDGMCPDWGRMLAAYADFATASKAPDEGG